MGRFIEDFAAINKGLGLYYGCRFVLWPRMMFRITKDNLYFNKVVNDFIRHHFDNCLQRYSDYDIKQTQLKAIDTIWVFWWQGYDSMPPVIKECYHSLLRNSNGYQVVLLTKDNICDYLTLPDFILQKFNEKKINFPHFSDIVRVLLLNLYGGLWIDAAIFVTRPIDIGNVLFFSPKMRNKVSQAPHLCKWVIGVMASQPNNPIFLYMQDVLFAYWKKFDGPFHYLMFDYLLRYGYENASLFKDIIDAVPVSSPDIHSSRYTFGKEVDYSHLDYLLENNQFLSLTYRIDYPLKTVDGEETYYAALLNKCI